METGSTAASSSSSVATNPPRFRPALRLIRCTTCGSKLVREFEAQTDRHGNQGRIFYKCFGWKANGSKCDFWHWEEAYIAHLKNPKTKQRLEELEAEDKKKLAVEKAQSKHLNMENEEGKNRDTELKEFLALAQEVVPLMKCFLVVLLLSLLLNAYAVIRG